MHNRKTKILTTIKAGALVRQAIYTPPSRWDDPKERGKKERASSAARQMMNDKRAKKKVELLLAANFTRRDTVAVLTYDDAHLPGSRREAVRCISKYLRRLRDAMRKQGRELRYIYFTEERHGEARLHHHIVLNLPASERDLVASLWDYGRVERMEHLRRDTLGCVEYEALAAYLTKESIEGRPVGARLWTASKNLKKPVRKTEWVSESAALTIPAGCIRLNEDTRWNAWGGFQFIEYYDPRTMTEERRKE